MEENTNTKSKYRLFEGYDFDWKTIVMVLLLLFVVGAVIGWLYEMGFYRIDRGEFIRRGHGFGPWLPIYGFGSLSILLFASPFRKKPLYVCLVSALVCALLEFGTGWVLYHFWDGLRLWDYNTEIWNWGNIGGYICLRSVLAFTAAGVFLVYILFPALCKLARRLPKAALAAVSLIPFGLFVADFINGYLVNPL